MGLGTESVAMVFIRTEVDSFPGDRRGNGKATANWLFEADENSLKLDFGDGCTTKNH